MTRFWHPRHAWRGIQLDRSQLWPVLTIGFWTVEFLPASIAARVVDLLRELRRKD